jgi:cell wall-associated NlpC family hydrolase
MNNNLVFLAMSYLGVHYKWGGDSFWNGLDCSGLAIKCLSELGLWDAWDTTAHGLYLHFKKRPGSAIRSTPCEGDLLFFGSAKKITHVAIAINATMMIEAGGGDSKTNTLDDAKRDDARVKVSPIHRRRDLVCCIGVL